MMNRAEQTRRNFLKCLTAAPLVGNAAASTRPSERSPAGPSPSSMRVQATDLYLDQPLPFWLEQLVAAKGRHEVLEAREALVCFGPAAVQPLLDVILSLAGPNSTALIECAARIGRPAIPGLLGMLDHRSARLRATACAELPEALSSHWRLTQFQDVTLANVLRALEAGSQAEVKASFDEAAGAFRAAEAEKRPDAGILAAVIGKLEDQVPAVRFAASEALGSFDCAPAHRADIRTALEHMLSDREQSVRDAARASLHTLDLRDACPRSGSGSHRTASISRQHCPVKEVGPLRTAFVRGRTGRQAVAGLLQGQARERVVAARAVGSTGSPSAGTIGEVAGTLWDADMAVRSAAAVALGRARHDKTDIGWQLWHAMKDPSSRVAEYSQISLVKVLVFLSSLRSCSSRPTGEQMVNDPRA